MLITSACQNNFFVNISVTNSVQKNIKTVNEPLIKDGTYSYKIFLFTYKI